MTAVTAKGIEYGWVPGENGWGDPMNENLVRLSAAVLPTVVSTSVSAQPGSPSDGDAYIIPTGATGAAWSGNDGKFTVWDADAATWWMFTPQTGWQIASQADSLTYWYTGSAWQALYGRVANGVVLPGTVVKLGTDASGANVAAQDFTFTAPLSTGAGTPAALIERVGVLGASGSASQTATEFWRKRGNSASATVAELLLGMATFRFIAPTTGIAFRDSTNAADIFTWNAAGTTITAPLATSVSFGASHNTFSETVVALVQSTSSATLNVGTGSGSGTSQVTIRGAAGQTRQLSLRTGTAQRVSFGLGSVAESGSNAGSDFFIQTFDDAGSSIDLPVIITRAAGGAVALGGSTNRQVIIAGSGWGAGNASLRLNGLTSGAGAATGTLTNAPSAGNPNFWIPINIAGTVRYIPAW